MIVIGDVHGCYKTLMALVDQLPEGKQICFTGDLIDRGHNSKEVVDFVRNNGHLTVMGNHEQMAYVAKADPTMRRIWFTHGGDKTVASFGDINETDYFIWARNLPLFIKYKNFIISHSCCFGVWHCKDKTLNNSMFEAEVLWNNNFGYENRMPAGYVNVVGHTIVEKPVNGGHYLMIDTGCVYNYKDYYNFLTAYDLDEDKFYFQPNIED